MPTLESAPVANLVLEQVRVIHAPRARVYEAWTNPELVRQWFGPAGWFSPNASLDPRVGGNYSMETRPTPEAIAANPEIAERCGIATGVYTRVVPNELLQFTWKANWSPGEESLVTISLKDVESGGTQLTLRHERFATEQSRNNHSQGWAGTLEKFAAVLQN
jgi:uncharacterized protein YndB with AHSA1/START domain